MGEERVTSDDLVEKLFRALPHSDFMDKNNKYLQTDGRYDGIFMFWDFPEYSGQRSRNFVLLKNIVLRVMEREGPSGIRAAFMNGVLSLISQEPTFDVRDGSARSRYLQYCKWVMQGRKTKNLPRALLPEDGDGSNRDSDSGSHNDDDQERDLRYIFVNANTGSICAHCNREGAQFRCTSCIQKNDDHITLETSYCDSDCQRADWKQHKRICFYRKSFARTVRIMKAFLDTIVEVASTFTITKSYEKDGAIYLAWRSQILDAMRGASQVHPFPHGSFADARHAMAAFGNELSTSTLFQLLLKSSVTNWLWSGMLPPSFDSETPLTLSRIMYEHRPTRG
ncbi:uncharacterized protein GGS25DRAFT_327361 [Hypoxylon fragiforme]|uniref:uncharacterized protein n=1 Tax=Hypoxylon fragiforme TaxID=63214 RepID=UPI0020C72AA3|nr:uncharacterized protein GGS25DRAFT_327361 [Hypoxylon fragiforme]KAI2607309.1 hypothetical protein GGS25DRAFT_327361 [Hypoxylon fragiforme]